MTRTGPHTPEHPEDRGAQLMLAWQGGDEGAFDQLVEAYSGQVFALLTRFLGRSSAREDMVQEVFLRVIRARDRYEPTARFTTWLYRIAFNLAVNETQRARGRAAWSLDQPIGDEEGGGHDAHDEDAPDPSHGLERGDTISAVRAAIASLPEGQRLALVLAKYHDMPYIEIGRVLDSSEKAVKSLIHRARETLRARLAPFLEEESV
jgi:RNA polymerase sigma-70 factor (ECF subfamily)